MSLSNLRRTWESLGTNDPLWAILTEDNCREGHWDHEAFFATGAEEMLDLSARMDNLGYQMKGKRVLDFGCGVGRISQALSKYFERVDGVDISASMLEHADRYNQVSDQCRYHHNTQPDLALFEENSFDFIYSRIVLQHMHPSLAKGYLAEFGRVLKPGGVMFFQMPDSWEVPPSLIYRTYKVIRRNVMSLWRWLQRKPRLAKMELHFLTIPKVTSLLRRLDLRLISVCRDDACGDHVNSYSYFVVKPPASTGK